MAFNTRPNPVALKQAEIDQLTSELEATRAYLVNAQQALEAASVTIEEPEHTVDELRDMLDCAKATLADHDAILCNLQSPVARDAFYRKKRLDVYNSLLDIQSLNKTIAQLHVARLTACILEAEHADIELDLQDAKTRLDSLMLDGQVDDWRCVRYLNSVSR